MEFEALLADFGYAALFLAFCLGIVGLPIPNEVVVMSGGALSSEGLLLPVPAFLMAFGGISCGLTVGFVIGRYVGLPILKRFGARGPKFEKNIERAQQLVGKYGSAALLFTYFIPFLRNLMPYVVGANAMKYRTFALYAYTGAFLWTAVFFLVGYFTGSNVAWEAWE
ncbi:DedA family protein [Paenibacillus sp.]|uniref:DedA family protein n=1 Tax=Paenibacillus sp. TaxID=58172 RepID=UPI0028113382|nr:DedA family protein [Paenibacillus sp.]